MKNRGIVMVAGAVLAGALAAGTLSSAIAQTQPGYVPGGMMSGQGVSPGMMGGHGPRMMGGGPGGMMGGWGTGATSSQTPSISSLDGAKQAFQRYIDATGQTNLALDEVMQFQWNYYAIVKDTSTGQGAFELLANPQTGAVFPEMGPNMMWNTRYSPMAGSGMMSGFSQQPSGPPTVSADQAQKIAQQWLDQNQPGSAMEAADVFPGYYTLHITRDGTVTGMLSVNSYTGQVWYHTWHGTFVSSTEA
jgi:hypothetical protein